MRFLKTRVRRVLATSFLFLAFILGCCTTLFSGDKMLKAADFSLKDLNGEVVQLSRLFGEGPIVINFWATWCKPCVKELPRLNQIYIDYRDKGVKVLAISEDSPWSVSKVKSFVSGNRYDFMVLLDTNGKVMRKYGLLGTPYTFVLNQEGEILYKHFGYRPGDENSLREEIDKALGVGDGDGNGGMNSEGSASG